MLFVVIMALRLLFMPSIYLSLLYVISCIDRIYITTTKLELGLCFLAKSKRLRDTERRLCSSIYLLLSLSLFVLFYIKFIDSEANN